jgi:hypothetical protein
MDLGSQRRRQAMDSLQVACKQFEVQYNPNSVNEVVIQKFLEETSHIDIEQSNKLIYLAGCLLGRLGWSETSKIYRHVIDGQNGTDIGTYIVWINAGLAMMADEKQEFEYRKHIAEDVEQLIKEASNGDDQWAAGFWGAFYVKHPLRNNEEPKWLQQAAKWMEIEIEQLRVAGDLGPHELCELADGYRQLGKLNDAARLYTEALAYDLSECCEDMTARSIEERLAMCRSQLPD